jgi:hypothetical protein
LERKDRSYYLINGKKGIELPTIPWFFHKKRGNVEFYCLLGSQKQHFLEKPAQNIKIAKPAFLNHLQHLI